MKFQCQKKKFLFKKFELKTGWEIQWKALVPWPWICQCSRNFANWFDQQTEKYADTIVKNIINVFLIE